MRKYFWKFFLFWLVAARDKVQASIVVHKKWKNNFAKK
jgi:hypothetical protein